MNIFARRLTVGVCALGVLLVAFAIASSPLLELHEGIGRTRRAAPTPLSSAYVASRAEAQQPSRSTFGSLNRLTAATSAAEARAAWKEALHEILNDEDTSQALQELRSILDGGHDQQLDSPLRVTVGGELHEAPTTRVYMLDILAELDSTEAAQYSRTIFESSTSSDEWAIALRNYAWGVDRAAFDPFLRARVLELLTNEQWISQPSSGFLESFDFAPYTRDPALIAPLVSLTKPDQPESVRRAAFLALARFHSQDSTSGLRGVSEAEAQVSFSPVRADAMSRADFLRVEDVEMVREYLLSSSVEPKEFALFVETFPQAGQFAGPALATMFQPERFAVLAKRDAQALEVVKEWLQNSEFEQRREDLTRIYERLVSLTESARRGGYL